VLLCLLLCCCACSTGMSWAVVSAVVAASWTPCCWGRPAGTQQQLSLLSIWHLGWNITAMALQGMLAAQSLNIGGGDHEETWFNKLQVASCLPAAQLLLGGPGASLVPELLPKLCVASGRTLGQHCCRCGFAVAPRLLLCQV